MKNPLVLLYEMSFQELETEFVSQHSNILMQKYFLKSANFFIHDYL